ncbi:hypothetical protein [Paraburkholderia humisilvae]|uniref:Uncharacterized protein n=1 Tax=Paraburkholderia humisilvae TaxID=627669 RepID=A0A6J5DM45_9BURK|nr:hypothetical protein [Paraburkholderia humisilvae]CAB3754075.1 hypothetical protein LMG29542_02240 [Paraburkholderia humisilvae]
MASTTYHIHIPIVSLLAMSDAELEETLSPGTGVELRAKLVLMQAAGKTVFTGDDCDQQDANGVCLGHRRD